MSENVPLPQDNLTENASGAAPAPALIAPLAVGTAEHRVASAPVGALPPVLPAEAHALLELVGRGLAPEADQSTRAAARDLWSRLAQSIVTAAPVAPTAPVMPPLPTMPTVPLPNSPIAIAARALRQLPPDQLLDLVLQRLRGALPAGTTVPAPKGIQFQLVPVAPPASVR
jgi:hypothetical protein